jgi:50S ribosomal protein L16 3-hydroxylase
MRMQLLGGLSGKEFLSQFWQKKPLLVRNAIPNFKGMVQAPELFALSIRDDIESRLVYRRGGAWHMQQGPFSRTRIAHLPKSGWTLLVQGLNLELPEADALLRRFRFLPYARLDDVMVSYAVTGGGVGPHFDSYDVFLLQGPGRRRWSVSRQRELQLDPKAPLRILRNFRPEKEWLLEPGDMLYLPPGWAHDGVALEPCFTYSIGFRAPSHQEVAREFLAFLQERVAFGGLYADRGAKPARRAAEIPKRMVQQAAAVTRKIRWRLRDVARFLGEYLSTPKPQIVFSRPRSPRPPARFAALCRARGLRLDLRTRMLFREREFFVNGERVEPPGSLRRVLARLADERVLPPGERLSQPLLRLLHDWYLAGWLRIGERHE